MSDFARLETLFHQAVELAGADREALMRRVRAEDVELADQLEVLIDADRNGQERLESAVRDGAAAVSKALARSRVGERIGPYRLAEVVGIGGGGVVYRADRDDAQYDGTAAIKLLHVDPGDRSLVDRLREERQILARLEHPNIARLYDAGTASDGTPFVVMEFVQGVPISTYCQERRLRAIEVVELFTTVCRTVEHAHRNLIVHRDLKPANVLVTSDGVPKLLDFGIATVLAPGESPATDGGRQRMLTPKFASPEQKRGDPATTATDVYSLGVLLESMLDHAGCRVDGDLQAIADEAMQFEPERRYLSVGELVQDIERRRDGYPVRARSDGWIYRARKLFLRHRWSAAVSATVGLLILLAAGITLRQADAARIARDRAESVSAVLVEMFEIAGPDTVDGITVRELLDHGSEKVAELSDQPATQAQLLDTLGELYENTGDLAEAARLFQRRVELHRDGLDDPEGAAAAAHDLGRALARSGEFVRARELFAEGMRIRERVLGRDRAELGSSYNAMALVSQELGAFDQAVDYYEKALDNYLRTLGEDSEYVTVVRGNLALLAYDTGRFEQAETRYREVLEKLPGPEAYENSEGDQAVMLEGLGLTLTAQGRHGEAVEALGQALEIHRRLHGEEHYLVARGRHHLGVARLQLGELGQAEALIQAALSQRRQELGEQHREYGESLLAMGRLRRAQGLETEAARLVRQAIEVFREALGDDHPRVAEARAAL